MSLITDLPSRSKWQVSSANISVTSLLEAARQSLLTTASPKPRAVPWMAQAPRRPSLFKENYSTGQLLASREPQLMLPDLKTIEAEKESFLRYAPAYRRGSDYSRADLLLEMTPHTADFLHYKPTYSLDVQTMTQKNRSLPHAKSWTASIQNLFKVPAHKHGAAPQRSSPSMPKLHLSGSTTPTSPAATHGTSSVSSTTTTTAVGPSVTMAHNATTSTLVMNAPTTAGWTSKLDDTVDPMYIVCSTEWPVLSMESIQDTDTFLRYTPSYAMMTGATHDIIDEEEAVDSFSGTTGMTACSSTVSLPSRRPESIRNHMPCQTQFFASQASLNKDFAILDKCSLADTPSRPFSPANESHKWHSTHKANKAKMAHSAAGSVTPSRPLSPFSVTTFNQTRPKSPSILPNQPPRATKSALK